MSSFSDKELTDALQRKPPAPPADLAARLKEQIPDELFEGHAEGPRSTGWSRGPVGAVRRVHLPYPPLSTTSPHPEFLLQAR